MSYVVASKVKEAINAKGMMSSGDLPEALSQKVESLLGEAAVRAEKNGRKTVRPEDL
jgi:histone H3/H4